MLGSKRISVAGEALLLRRRRRIGARIHAGWSPMAPSGLTLWLDANVAGTITSSGGKVSQWADLSGQGNNFVQAVETNKPSTGTQLINGLNAIDFDGVDNFMTSTATLGDLIAGMFAGTEYTVFLVASVDVAGAVDGFGNHYDQDAFLATSDAYWGLHLFSQSLPWTFQPYFNDGTTLQNVDAVDLVIGTGYLLESRYDDGALYARVDGLASPAPVNTDPVDDTTGTMILGRSYATHYLDGRIGELLVYSQALGAPDRIRIRSYLASKWGV